MRLALSLVFVAGCSFTSDDPVPHYVENEGRVCLRAATQLESGDVYETDAPVFVSYRSPVCLDGCDKDPSATCAVSGVGTSLAITSTASWSRDASHGDGCPAICGFARAQCETAPLPAGTYTFTFASESLTLTVPSTSADSPCALTPGAVD